MCGRFTRSYTWAQIAALYGIGSPPLSNLPPRYNICPTDTIDVVIRVGGERVLTPMRWGLVPRWWDKSPREMRLATFNARAETLTGRPMFRGPFQHGGRCLIPASGYYEWRSTPSGKQPYFFTRVDGVVMTFAGLQDAWRDPQTGETLRSCTMVVTEPNRIAAQVHDRMPVILEPSAFEQWERGTPNDAAALLRPAADDVLQMWPVSRRVNSSRADDSDASLIERVEP
jgi:putative SOS response-associated peptidase YedK